MKKLLLLFAAIMMASTGLWAQTKNVTYRYPVYYTEGDAASGIKEWKTTRVDATLVQGSESTAVLGADDTETWYVVTEGRLLMKNGLDIKGTVNLIICDYDTLILQASMKKAPLTHLSLPVSVVRPIPSR